MRMDHRKNRNGFLIRDSQETGKIIKNLDLECSKELSPNLFIKDITEMEISMREVGKTTRELGREHTGYLKAKTSNKNKKVS